MELSQPAFAHELAGHLVHHHGALLAAHLDHAFVFPGRANQGAAFLHIQRQRLLGIDILARLNRVNAAQHAAVIVGADDDAVNVFLFQHAAVVVVNAPLRVPLRRRFLAPVQITVGYGHDLRIFRQLVDEQVTAVADPDHADTDSIVGAKHAS